MTRSRRRTRAAAALLALGLACALAACAPGRVEGPASTGDAGALADALGSDGLGPATPTDDDARGLASRALGVLASIPIAPRTPWDGPFDRAGAFGARWADPDGNGCDARNDALRSNMPDARLLDDGCRVASGTLRDLYTGEEVAFTKGDQTSDDVQIDHVVALYDAWRTGAQALTFEERERLANDPLELQPTAAWVNDEKGNANASQWLPPNVAYRCAYVERQVAIKASYRLWMTQPEHDAIAELLAGCAA